jgi:hypothetical protein
VEPPEALCPPASGASPLDPKPTPSAYSICAEHRTEPGHWNPGPYNGQLPRADRHPAPSIAHRTGLFASRLDPKALRARTLSAHGHRKEAGHAGRPAVCGPSDAHAVGTSFRLAMPPPAHDPVALPTLPALMHPTLPTAPHRVAGIQSGKGGIDASREKRRSQGRRPSDPHHDPSTDQPTPALSPKRLQHSTTPFQVEKSM